MNETGTQSVEWQLADLRRRLERMIEDSEVAHVAQDPQLVELDATLRLKRGCRRG